MGENNSNLKLLPWPIYNKFFTLVSQDEKNYYSKYKLCCNVNQKLSSSIKSASNYKKHIKVSETFIIIIDFTFIPKIMCGIIYLMILL